MNTCHDYFGTPENCPELTLQTDEEMNKCSKQTSIDEVTEGECKPCLAVCFGYTSLLIRTYQTCLVFPDATPSRMAPTPPRLSPIATRSLRLVSLPRRLPLSPRSLLRLENHLLLTNSSVFSGFVPHQLKSRLHNGGGTMSVDNNNKDSRYGTHNRATATANRLQQRAGYKGYMSESLQQLSANAPTHSSHHQDEVSFLDPSPA
jgi:hypothetical protein